MSSKTGLIQVLPSFAEVRHRLMHGLCGSGALLLGVLLHDSMCICRHIRDLFHLDQKASELSIAC